MAVQNLPGTAQNVEKICCDKSGFYLFGFQRKAEASF
jgi:hypothetical protein